MNATRIVELVEWKSAVFRGLIVALRPLTYTFGAEHSMISLHDSVSERNC